MENVERLVEESQFRLRALEVYMEAMEAGNVTEDLQVAIDQARLAIADVKKTIGMIPDELNPEQSFSYFWDQTLPYGGKKPFSELVGKSMSTLSKVAKGDRTPSRKTEAKIKRIAIEHYGKRLVFENI